MIAALEYRQNSVVTMLISAVHQCLGHPLIVLGAEIDAPERIILVGIKAG